ncbi:MAG: hypothetical protein AAGC91_10200 [Pseudomonadota bacterium]
MRASDASKNEACEGANHRVKGSTVYSLGSALAGAVIYGGWAYYVNMGDGAAMAARTSAVQGTFSFCLTLSMSLLLTSLYERFGRTVFAACVSLMATCVFIFCTAYGLQYLAGSHEILMTIAPGFVIGSTYAAIFLITLHRSHLHDDNGVDSDNVKGNVRGNESSSSAATDVTPSAAQRQSQ